MKKTFLASLLTLILAVSCAFGLAACNNDEEQNPGNTPVTIKLGDNELAEIDGEGTTYAIEGTLNKEYTLTAKKDGTQCDDVLMFISAGYSGNGTVTFTYTNTTNTVKVAANNDAKKLTGVTIVMEEVTYPVGSTKNPEALAVGAVKNFSVTAESYYYTVTVAEAGSYVLTVTGDVCVEYANALNGEQDGLLEDETTVVELNSGVAVIALSAGVNYIAVAANDFEATAPVTGTIKVEKDEAKPAVNYITTTGVTIENLTKETGATYTIQLPETAEGDVNLKFTAKVNGNVAANVVISYGTKQGNPVEGVYSALLASSISVYITDNPDDDTDDNIENIANVKIEMEVVEPEDVDYPKLTLEQLTTATGASFTEPVIYEVTITDGGVYVLDGIDSVDFVIGTTIEGGEVIASVWFSDVEDHENEITLEAGKYYVAVCSDTAFTFSKAVTE